MKHDKTYKITVFDPLGRGIVAEEIVPDVNEIRLMEDATLLYRGKEKLPMRVLPTKHSTVEEVES